MPKWFLKEFLKLGGTQLFFDGCMPHVFPKVGSRERIFLEKWGGLGNETLENLCLESWNFGQNKAENANFCAFSRPDQNHDTSVLTDLVYILQSNGAWTSLACYQQGASDVFLSIALLLYLFIYFVSPLSILSPLG